MTYAEINKRYANWPEMRRLLIDEKMLKEEPERFHAKCMRKLSPEDRKAREERDEVYAKGDWNKIMGMWK